jgi:hypothetical protein
VLVVPINHRLVRWEQVKSRQRDLPPAVEDVDWAGSVAQAATADVRELLRAERRRRRGRWFAGVLVVLAVGAVVVLLVRSSVFQPVAGDQARGGPAVAVADDPAAMLDVHRPFASTPAAKWADGDAGIVLPETKAVSGFSSAEVADAVRSVRDVLVASRLDPRLLTEHDPAGFLDLLAPDARRQLAPLFDDGRAREVQSLVSMVAVGNPLLPVDAKVSGSMSVDDGDAGELVVHTNYVFAYAFQPQKPTRLVDAMNVIVIVRADVDYVLRGGDRWTPSSRGLWYGDASGFSYSIGCDSYRKGYLAPAATEPSVSDAPVGGGAQYFDPTAPLPPAGGCQR